MRSVRHKGTKAERALWEKLRSLRLVFETNQRPIPQLRREADVLFRQEKVAIFVDGCFWHGCPTHGTQAKANADFWQSKIERNKARDAETNIILSEDGWLVIRVWEHVDPEEASQRIQEILTNRQKQKELKGQVIVLE